MSERWNTNDPREWEPHYQRYEVIGPIAKRPIAIRYRADGRRTARFYVQVMALPPGPGAQPTFGYMPVEYSGRSVDRFLATHRPGHLIHVSGQLQWREWSDKETKERYGRWEVKASNLTFINPGPTGRVMAAKDWRTYKVMPPVELEWSGGVDPVDEIESAT